MYGNSEMMMGQMPYDGAGMGTAGMGTPGMGNAAMKNAGMAAAAGMGGLGMLGMNPNAFFFLGNSLSLRARLDSLSPDDLRKFTDAQITVTGQQIKPRNTACKCVTLFAGFICILPYFFMWCDWWKKCAL